MIKLNVSTMRYIEVKVAAAICRIDGRFSWKHIRNIKDNPKTAHVYYNYLRMGKIAVKTIEKEQHANGHSEFDSRYTPSR